MFDSFAKVLSSEPSYLAIGALLAGLIGYIANAIQERQRLARDRKALGSLLHGELINASPKADPVYHDPPNAPAISLLALPRLLESGAIDPQKEADLFMHLIHLQGAVERYNDAAQMYNCGWLMGVSREKQSQYFNLLQGCNWDYTEAHQATIDMLSRIGPPVNLPLWSHSAHPSDSATGQQ